MTENKWIGIGFFALIIYLISKTPRAENAPPLFASIPTPLIIIGVLVFIYFWDKN